MAAAEQKNDGTKKHVSIVICGHVDAGKSTTTGRLIFELGGIAPRDMEKLREEAKTLGKESFAFAFFMDKTKEERSRGVTMVCTTKEFFTAKYHYSIIDAPIAPQFQTSTPPRRSQSDKLPHALMFVRMACPADIQPFDPQASQRMRNKSTQRLRLRPYFPPPP